MGPENSCGSLTTLITSNVSIERMLTTEGNNVATSFPSGLGWQCFEAISHGLVGKYTPGVGERVLEYVIHFKLLENRIFIIASFNQLEIAVMLRTQTGPSG